MKYINRGVVRILIAISSAVAVVGVAQSCQDVINVQSVARLRADAIDKNCHIKKLSTNQEVKTILDNISPKSCPEVDRMDLEQIHRLRIYHAIPVGIAESALAVAILWMIAFAIGWIIDGFRNPQAR